MPRGKAVGGRAVTEQMGAASAALLELNDHWIAYLRWRKAEAADRLRATGDLDEVLADLGEPGGGDSAAPPAPDEGAGISPWAAAGPGADLVAWDLPAAADGEAAGTTASGSGIWADWAAAGEPADEQAEAAR